MDYGDFIVHIFSETARAYYDLERLWRHAKVVDPLPLQRLSLPGVAAALTTVIESCTLIIETEAYPTPSSSCATRQGGSQL